MKILLTILLSIVYTNTFSQLFGEKNKEAYLNYKLVDAEIIWQKIYKTDNSKEEIIDYLTKNIPIKIDIKDDSTLVGRVEKINLRINPKGVSLFKYPLYFNVKVECKEKKYRVTVSQISSSKKGGVVIEGTGRAGGRDLSIEKEYVVFDKINKDIAKDPGLSFNNKLESMFTIKKNTDNW